MPIESWEREVAVWRSVRGSDGRYDQVRVEHCRLMSFGQPLGPWRATYREAEEDALRLRVGTRYRKGGPIFLTVPAWIWRVDPCPVTERALRRAGKPRLVEVSDAGRAHRAA